jgi:predicted 3-demethylubiquinone-9 3-methyltransferase (glyoxalase superfamily)
VGLNGGPDHPFTQAVSFQILCQDQAEIDRLWAALSEGGEEVACGWLTDRWGLSWQITPARLIELINDPDRARAKRAMEAMMQMVKIDLAAIERSAG